MTKGFQTPGWMYGWLPGKETTVTGNNKLIRTWNVSADIQEQQDLNRYADACREECSKEQEIYIQLMDLFSKGRTGNPSEEEKECDQE